MEGCDFSSELFKRAEEAANTLIRKLSAFSRQDAKPRTLALAESCTAGLVSALLAETPGASGVLWGSFVCYTKEAKISMLGLDSEKLASCGLVSEETARGMADGALEKSGADIAAGVTGLAGPGAEDASGSPVGTVWIAAALKNGHTRARKFHFTGSRNNVRILAAIAALEEISEAADA
ncbi:MAG: nicotinamide-nucleotide amidohydrolase family protein [Treponema sp.]|jgi:nicotinamide-nucleotide amidase|nr:nicotinamide-nucleotide amidohydrolase family protein [Treponema sp.]